MSDVEFQGGRAIEQTEALGDAVDANENREAAKKAVRDAIAKASKPPSKVGGKLPDDSSNAHDDDDSKPAGKAHSGTKPRVEKPVKRVEPESSTEETDEEADESDEHEASKPDSDEDAQAVKRVLKNRAKIAKEKAAAAEEQRQWQTRLAQERAEIEHARRQIQEQAAYLQRLKSNPVEAVQQAGWDPEQFILDLAQSGTPEGKQAAQLRQMQEQLQQQKAWQENLVRQQQEQFRRAQEHQALQFRDSIEKQYLGRAMDAKLSPHTAAFYKGREAELISAGDIIAAQYRELTGKEAEVSDIAEYIEEQLAERAKGWYEQLRKEEAAKQELADQEEPEEAPEPPQGAKRRNASKTLTPGSGGERRALQKDLSGLDDEELKEVAKQNVRLAISKYKAPKA